jgi:hypothetical protein
LSVFSRTRTREAVVQLCTMVSMDESTNNLVTTANLEAPAKSNRGRFVPGDPRINLRGRPRKAPPKPQPAKPVSGPIMTLFVSGSFFQKRLTWLRAPWIRNLPSDWEIVAGQWDSIRQGLALTIRSKGFRVIETGQAVPEFKPCYNGLKWR